MNQINAKTAVVLTLATAIAGALVGRNTVVIGLTDKEAKDMLGSGRARVATAEDESLAVFDALGRQSKPADPAGESLLELMGSNRLPAKITIGGKEGPTADLVRYAFEQSELTREEWNALPEETRENILEQAILVLESNLKPATQEAGAKSASKAAKVKA